MTLRRCLNFLRWFFLSLCLAAAATRYVWEGHKDLVDDADEALKWAIQKGPHDAIAEAKALQEAGKSDLATELLETHAERLVEVRHGDRLERYRIQILDLLRNGALREGRTKDALRWALELSELDPRRVPNELSLASILNDLGRSEEALQHLDPIRRLAPLSGADVQAKVLTETLRAGPSALALGLNQLVSTGEVGPLALPLEGWEVRILGTDGDWTRARRFSLAPATDAGLSLGSGQVTGQVELIDPETNELVPSVKLVRIDAPRGSSFEAHGLATYYVASDGSVTAPVGASDLESLVQIEREDGVLHANGRVDPSFRVPAPRTDVTSVELTLGLKLTLPQDLQELLSTDEALAVRAALRTDLEEGAALGNASAAASLARLRFLESMVGV